MNTDSDRRAVQTAFDRLVQLLPKKLRGALQPCWRNKGSAGPDYVERNGLGVRHWRVRILPVMRKPSGLWSAAWCFYELGVGEYEDCGGTFRSQVQFLMAGNAAVCGSGAYNLQVDGILDVVARKRKDVVHRSIQRGTAAHLWVRTRDVMPEQMAQDMRWIINETLPGIQANRQLPGILNPVQKLRCPNRLIGSPVL